ncbi:hypothetical protein BKA62DRAFT_715680 [Auriculariales sp. MPI-PUGE-AT-0066]|nr:hypothetical protein BKA62DRAFT_715680 [Auriculariales sp. MPI-PUGE-AT-0066]
MTSAAKSAKDKGNAAFKASDFVGAIGHYTDAHLADRLEPTYPLNRAAAYLKLGKFADAERDCTTALALSHGNVKALFRRAQARSALRKLDDAEKGQSLIMAEPANEAVKQEMAKLQQLRVEIKNAAKTAPTVLPAPAPASSPATPPGTKPVRRRIPIEIVEDDVPAAAAPAAPPSTKTSDQLTAVSSRPLNGATAATTPAVPKSILKTPSDSAVVASQLTPTSFQAARESREQTRKPKVGGGIFRSNGTHSLFKGSTGESSVSAAATTDSSTPSSSAAATSSATLLLPVATQDAKPTTLFALEREWAQTKSPEARWNHLSLQTSLEPEFFYSLLVTMATVATSAGATADVRNAMREYLQALAKVPRFDTLVMFLSGSEKETIRGLLSALGLRSWGGISLS